MKRTKRPPKVHATQAKYIDPVDCGSLVSYIITSRRRVNASVDLTDCNRKITWYFDSAPGNTSIQKIDTVINLLSDFKRDLLAARKSFSPRRYPKG